MTAMPVYRSRGARALVLLHEESLREFVGIWGRAKEAEIRLPITTDPSYDSLEHLLSHILGAARSYMNWACECLALPDPGIQPPPPVEGVEAEVHEYVEHLLEKWRFPLATVAGESLESATYKSRWGVQYCLDAMLEHAVMHPKRHSFQLQELLHSVQTPPRLRGT